MSTLEDVRSGGNGYVGQALRRKEDPPLITGRGRFAADINFPRQLHMRVVRSNHAHGKIISIDIESGDYAIDDDLLKAAHRVLDRHPDAALWMQRIGYDAVYAFGSSLMRTTE